MEPWMTWRFGRNDFYNRIDTRIETEFGLTDRLQMAWYLNLSAFTEETGTGRVSEFEFEGSLRNGNTSSSTLRPTPPVSPSTWRNLSSSEAEIEQKFIVDKEFGNSSPH